MTTIRLTSTQAAMLADRLSCPECIADALDGWKNHPDPSSARDSLNLRCELLERMTLTGRINLDQLDEFDRVILADAHDGSTWWAQQEGEAFGLPTNQQALHIARATRTVKAVQRKLAAAGIPVGEPVLW